MAASRDEYERALNRIMRYYDSVLVGKKRVIRNKQELQLALSEVDDHARRTQKGASAEPRFANGNFADAVASLGLIRERTYGRFGNVEPHGASSTGYHDRRTGAPVTRRVGRGKDGRVRIVFRERGKFVRGKDVTDDEEADEGDDA
jgi:hypothetical protein